MVIKSLRRAIWKDRPIRPTVDEMNMMIEIIGLIMSD